MNNSRRKAIAEMIAKLNKIDSELIASKDNAEIIRDDEQEYLDGMPAGLQGAKPGNTAEKAINNLDIATRAIGNAIDGVKSAMIVLERVRNG